MTMNEQGIDELCIDSIAQYTLENGIDQKPPVSDLIHNRAHGADRFKKSIEVNEYRAVEVDGYKILVKDEIVKWTGGTMTVHWSNRNIRSLEIFSKEYKSGEYPILRASKILGGETGITALYSNTAEPIEPTSWEIQFPPDTSIDFTEEIKNLYHEITPSR